MGSSSAQNVVNIHQLSATTEEKLRRLPPLSSECCIYNVPDRMRASNEEHFTPRIVSIGPIHYQKEKLMAMEHLKDRYLAEFLQLSGKSLDGCLQLIWDNEKRLRNCYAHVIELDSETFVKMVLVDAAFLVMILLYESFTSLLSSTDRIFGKPKMIYEIRYDMMLLENQLPFFILGDLYKFSKLQNILRSRFYLTFDEETAMNVFAHDFFRGWISPKFLEGHPPSEAEHILDLFRSSFIPAGILPQRTEAEIETTNMPSMKELYQAGVKIQVGSKENIFDIRFHDGILEIPPIRIFDHTELMFRNLLAFEQSHYPGAHKFFSSYVEIMRLFTLSSADTELLIQKNVIYNGLPNAKRVSTLFQNISTGNVLNWSQFQHGHVIRGLHEYYKVCLHRWNATGKQKYFKAPWAICSVSAAVLLLVLTIVQTVFTILQVVLPK